MWMRRCYKDGIPDEVPEGISKSMRAPSYKSIAMALLRNDFRFKSLGFHTEENESCAALRREKKKQESGQGELF